jgi:hypothetical protein
MNGYAKDSFGYKRVSTHPKRPTPPTINRKKNERQNANPSQNKKSCNLTHKPILAAHFVLTKSTQSHQ